MKQIRELKKNIADHNFLMAQFDIDPGYAILEVPESQLRFGDRIVGEINDLYKIERQEKILFVNPQLSGKYLYKMIIPYLKASSVPGLAIAITSLSDYSIQEQLEGYTPLAILSKNCTSEDQIKMIGWATRIVFPFCAQPLQEIYDHIRDINPDCKVEFCIDFNCWELPNDHPLKSDFDDIILPIFSDNMYFADSVIVSNEAMRKYLVEKLTQIVNTTHFGIERIAINESIEIIHEPLIISEDIVFENVDYDPKEIIFKAPAIKEIKEPVIKVQPKIADTKKKKKPKIVIKTPKKKKKKI